jgi:hypothetical protein
MESAAGELQSRFFRLDVENRHPGLAVPDQAKVVRAAKDGEPITDGVFPESKEFLAGYWMIDVESAERAYAIAARVSAVPGPGGIPSNMPIEVRQIMSRLVRTTTVIPSPLPFGMSRIRRLLRPRWESAQTSARIRSRKHEVHFDDEHDEGW